MTFPYLVGSNLRIGKVIRKARFFLKALQLIPEKVLPNVIKRYTNSFNIYDLKGYVPVSFISGASFLVNKQKYIAAGGFDEGFFLYDEDMDLSQRFKNNGLHNYIICNVLVKTINSSTTRKLKSIELKKIKRRSRKHLIIKHFKGIRKLVLLWMNEITWPLL
jgi:GT2 family glycosyltransferase